MTDHLTPDDPQRKKERAVLRQSETDPKRENVAVGFRWLALHEHLRLRRMALRKADREAVGMTETDPKREAVEAAAKAITERYGRLGILSRTVIYRHPSPNDIAEVVIDAYKEATDDQPSPQGGRRMIRAEVDPKGGTITLHLDKGGLENLREGVAEAEQGRKVFLGDPGAMLILRPTTWEAETDD